MALELSTKDFRKLLAFGSGVGIEICASDLEVAATRVRPNGIQVLGRMTIENYAQRPAAEWGAEYARFLKLAGAERISATVLLPRREVIVRQIALPGVADKDIEGAIRFQLDSLHPYGDDEVVWGWSPLAYGSVLVGIARREVVDRYVSLFAEADIAVASFTFSAAAVHAAIRLNGIAELGEGFVALSRTEA
ncbi:MAG: Fimbrial assembly family protein, partial [Candidatus Solibacter sp.]|nr:Fimbrial assembly family protein [Candidatus Solibacter sp.]